MKKTISAIAIGFGLIASGASVNALAQGAETPELTRAQVQEDLKAWRAAGFDQNTYDDLTFDVFGNEYKERVAKYKQLRAAN